ncbi:tripartite tricarboxylate transporter TctB family protein [Bosea minatitlanensis]|uniref:Tripartite tricarboxylate transporter TctB family protein n=1 Tax=Bosea minatitlanensis TaxID=128782 RepID=A0ABW0F881_9HYPH|nr:tripartite tricarboxylate transporter TctB family protein [Bosea minatitlanensis]MCT4493291.1 tripartite tricarboxylate transporter TctB family protein [Bosea minatitlanensis]
MSLNQIERAQGLRIRSTQDFAGGLFMILLAIGAYVFSWELPAGTLRQLGPGMLPKAFAAICGLLGLMLSLSALRYHGEKLAGWSWRGIFFALGGACLFGLTIRGFEFGPIRVPALGLMVAGPLLIFFSGLAADDRKLPELLIFAVAMSAACILLFKYALSLPIPLAPWLLGI